MSFQARDQGRAQMLDAFRWQRPVVLVADQEDVLDPLAEGGDARVVHAQPVLAQNRGHLRQLALHFAAITTAHEVPAQPQALPAPEGVALCEPVSEGRLVHA